MDLIGVQGNEEVFTARVRGDEYPRIAIEADGTIKQGAGTNPPVESAPPRVSRNVAEMTGAMSNTGPVPIFNLDPSTTTTTTGRIPAGSFAGWSTFGIDIRYLNIGTATGDIVWRVEYKFMGDGDSTSGTLFPADVVQTHQAGSLVERVFRYASSIPVVPGKDFTFRVYRLGGNVLDTLADAVQLIGIDLIRDT
jgi:hypothetical protein